MDQISSLLAEIAQRKPSYSSRGWLCNRQQSYNSNEWNRDLRPPSSSSSQSWSSDLCPITASPVMIIRGTHIPTCRNNHNNMSDHLPGKRVRNSENNHGNMSNHQPREHVKNIQNNVCNHPPPLRKQRKTVEYKWWLPISGQS